MDKDKINQLENLTEEEKKAVLDILNEYSNKGTSDIYQNLIYADYKEIPVDIDTFLHDPRYLGKGLVDDEGRFTVFPYWEKKLKELFPNNLDTTYNNVILTGCLGYDTEIPLLNGKVLKIGELVQLAKTSQLNEYVYAFDVETNKYVPGHLINAFSTGVKKVYKITLDNGEWFTATSNHKFLTRDKHWKSIDSGLSVGDSLMPFYRDYKCVNSIRKYSLYERTINYNHTITNIEFFGEQEVFDLTVDKYHNFALKCGIVAHNSIGTGKTLFSVVCMLYMLYRMLCLKDPYKHYGLQPIDLITFSFMNITKDAAKGVGWNKCQQLLQSSSWFMERGQVTGSLEPEWHPVGGIELIYGSLPRHVIGRAVFCLDEDTSIVTTTENKTIKDLINNREPILTYNISTKDFEITTQYEVLPTGISNEEYQIELEDDTLIKCTPNHKFLLSTEKYKEAKDLSNEDVLFGITNIKIKTINKITLPQSKQYYDIIDSTPHHNFVIATNTGGVVSHNCSFEDEISFQPNQDLEKQKEKAKLLVSSIEARMKSRYMKGEKLPTLHLLASSKRTEQSFLETWIETKKKNESKTTLIVDEPQWVIRTDKDSPRKFVVAVGNKFLENEVLPLDVKEEDLQIYRDKGYQLMYVPMGYYENFLDDLDIALTDIAGISTSNAMNYISGVRWSNVRNNEIKNPFTKEVLEVGNDPKDKTQYYDFFDFSQLPKNMLSKPLYVHLDMSISGDKTGIAGVWIKGKKPQKEGEPPSQELFYRVAFSVAIKAPKGRQISFEKNRQFIYWLREQGLNVKGVSSDSFQSADLGQTLNARGYNYSTISVDRVKDGKCEPYQVFKSAIYEERIEIYPTKLLTEEIIGLVRDGNGKIDHSPAGVNCLTGDTLISLVDGREVSIKELVDEYNEGKTNYVYSFNHDTNTIEPKLIEKAWCSGKNAKIIEVFLDNGTSVKCTPEHRFMLRDGSYKEAGKLKEQTVIMSFCDNDNIIYADGIHKVVSVKMLDYVEDVYDLTISKNHNFALSCGIFVHNSKDISDATCAAIYNASQHAEEYAYDYGEDLNLIEETNTQSLQTNALKNQMTVDFEQELQRVFNPIANNPVNSNIQQRNIEDEPITFISNDMIIW